ncbi:MAG: sodium:proton antiporter NhaD [Bacteroidetes bacterium]|nr:sodium:proton antiporter NhaD [Bacteroidota bacterium]
MLLAVVVTFITGYIAIALEHRIRVNKSATALLTGVLCWAFYILVSPDKQAITSELTHHLGNLSQILFFLMGAMTIVELIDAHDGFEIITQRITTTDKRKLLWIIGLLSFLLSAILDNLTTTIVMLSLVRKLMSDKKNRLIFAGLIVIAANAGGAWSPIGDVTTTMLWIGGQITAVNIIFKLVVPSLVCLLVPLLFMRISIKGNIKKPKEGYEMIATTHEARRQRNIVFITGLIVLLLVPVFKTVTHLPPFMGILFGLGLMWVVTEMIHSGKDEADRKNYTVAYALRKIDTPSILFFLGILLAIAALESTGQLVRLAGWMDTNLKDQNLIVLSIGLLSSLVDNVPLVAAATGMYDLNQYPVNSQFWEFLAYCTGTGGSILIIGSAAGVAAMGIEKIDFIWYLKRVGWLALAGYFAGAITYMLQAQLIAH